MRRVDPERAAVRTRASARAHAGAAFIISCVFRRAIYELPALIGARREIYRVGWSAAWAAGIAGPTRVASFPISLKEPSLKKRRGRGEDGKVMEERIFDG